VEGDNMLCGLVYMVLLYDLYFIVILYVVGPHWMWLVFSCVDQSYLCCVYLWLPVLLRFTVGCC